MDFHVDVGQYAGPLDLLLFLVKREELDLSSIRLSKLTEQFQSYLEVLVEINVDDVGEFLEMASVLIEMKLKLLLPTDAKPEESEEVVLEDPADQLVERLVQYKRYRDAASILDEQSRRWQLRYSRLANDLPSRRNDADEQPIADLEIWDLVSAFGRIPSREPTSRDHHGRLRRYADSRAYAEDPSADPRAKGDRTAIALRNSSSQEHVGSHVPRYA